MDNIEKLTIKNRNGQNLVILVEENKNPKGLVFVMHGLSGFKEQLHILTIADAFKEKDFTVIRFDTTNTFGESDGDFEDATTTNYYEDLEDVIKWSKSQPWYEEPFVLTGHSLGGFCIALYAERYPNKVKAIAPISTVVSGKLTKKAYGQETIRNWKKIGWLITESRSKPGLIKKLKWNFMVDIMKYDLLKNIDKLTIPTLLIVGENDESTPLEHQRILFNAITGKKELHVVKNAPHTFREERHLKEIRKIFLDWIELI